MTHDPTRADHDLDQWLTTTKTDLLAGLDDIIDLDAGLTDATLATRAHATITSLNDIVNLDAGLTHILPTTTPSTALDHQSTTNFPLTKYAHNFAARPAAQRLAARAWFPTHFLTLTRDLIRIQARARNLARELTRTLERELTRDFEHDRELSLTCARELTRTLTRARSLASTLERARILEHDREITRTLERARDLTRTVERARDLARELTRTPDHARSRARARARDLTYALTRARDLDLKAVRHEIATIYSRTIHLARSCARGHDRALDNALRHASTTSDEIEATPADLDKALPLLNNALSDATDADLTDANLQNVSLDGVIWSTGTHGTRWPPDLEQHVRQNSVLIGPDLYQITKFHTGLNTPTSLTI